MYWFNVGHVAVLSESRTVLGMAGPPLPSARRTPAADDSMPDLCDVQGNCRGWDVSAALAHCAKVDSDLMRHCTVKLPRPSAKFSSPRAACDVRLFIMYRSRVHKQVTPATLKLCGQSSLVNGGFRHSSIRRQGHLCHTSPFAVCQYSLTLRQGSQFTINTACAGQHDDSNDCATARCKKQPQTTIAIAASASSLTFTPSGLHANTHSGQQLRRAQRGGGAPGWCDVAVTN